MAYYRKNDKEGDKTYIEKTKRIKLTGKKLRQLNAAIHHRDQHRCIICGAYVEPGRKFHHEPCGIYRSDEIEKGVLLCDACHFKRHHTGDAAYIREKIITYLRRLYGEKGARKE